MEPLGPLDAAWMPDSASPACLGGCARPFTLLRRRHHCRACGRLICAGCSGSTMLGRARAVHRVCADTARCRGAVAVAMPLEPPASALGAAQGESAAGNIEYLQPTSQDGYTRQPLASSSHAATLPVLVCASPIALSEKDKWEKGLSATLLV